MAQSVLNGSFINNSRPKLLARVVDSGVVRSHSCRETLLVASEDTEVTLLTFDIFCRVYAYRWLCKLHRDKIHKNYSTHNTLVGSFMVTLFYLVGEMMMDEKIKKCIKTGSTLSGKFKTMSKKIRPIVPLAIKKKAKKVDTSTNRLISDAPLM